MFDISIDGVAPGRRQKGRPRKTPEGIVSKEGVMFYCPACMRCVHHFCFANFCNGVIPLVCRLYKLEFGKWSCGARFGVRPAGDPEHMLEEGRRFVDGGLEVHRRVEKQFGKQARAGPCRDFAIPAVGEAEGPNNNRYRFRYRCITRW